MAQYQGHVKFNLLVGLPLFLTGIYFFLKPSYPLVITFGSVFTYCTLFMNPDLDLANQIRLFSIRGLLTLPFRSYAKLFSHRGLSHHFLLGSLTRIAWLAGWALLFFVIYYKSIPTKRSLHFLYRSYYPYVFYGLAAICLADWCHLLLDRKTLKK